MRSGRSLDVADVTNLEGLTPNVSRQINFSCTIFSDSGGRKLHNSSVKLRASEVYILRQTYLGMSSDQIYGRASPVLGVLCVWRVCTYINEATPHY